jgi:putative membrane protein
MFPAARPFNVAREDPMLLHHVVQFFVFALAVLITAKVVPGLKVKSFGGALLFAVVLALLNKLCLWALIMLSLPLVILTFGLFIIVINAFLYWVADKLVDGVELDGFGSALAASAVTSLINWGITAVLHLI